MTATAWTKGPWYTTQTHVQSAMLNEDNYVCEAEGDTPEQAEANAHLIAAAPELHAALEEVLHYAETPGDFTDEEARNAMLDAGAALAKAEGRTP